MIKLVNIFTCLSDIYIFPFLSTVKVARLTKSYAKPMLSQIQFSVTYIVLQNVDIAILE